MLVAAGRAAEPEEGDAVPLDAGRDADEPEDPDEPEDEVLEAGLPPEAVVPEEEVLPEGVFAEEDPPVEVVWLLSKGLGIKLGKALKSWAGGVDVEPVAVAL